MAGQGVLTKSTSWTKPVRPSKLLRMLVGREQRKDADGGGEHDHGVTSWRGRPASAATTRPSHSGSGAESRSEVEP